MTTTLRPAPDYYARSLDLTGWDPYAAGYRAGLVDARAPSWPRRHRLLTIALMVTVLALGVRLHPIVLLVGLATLAVLSPVLLAALAVELAVRQHRRWRTPWRTVALVASWALCVLVIVVATPAALPILFTLALGWGIEHAERVHRSREVTGPGL